MTKIYDQREDLWKAHKEKCANCSYEFNGLTTEEVEKDILEHYKKRHPELVND